MKDKLENIWYHYKAPILIISAILLVLVYFAFQKASIQTTDYQAAIVSPDYYSEEAVTSLSEALKSHGTDLNGDGIITVQVVSYHIVLGAENQNVNEIGALDADLVGKNSGLFFLADPMAFETSTNGICLFKDAAPVSSFDFLSGLGFDSLYAVVRPDHPDAEDYKMLF